MLNEMRQGKCHTERRALSVSLGRSLVLLVMLGAATSCGLFSRTGLNKDSANAGGGGGAPSPTGVSSAASAPVEDVGAASAAAGNGAAAGPAALKGFSVTYEGMGKLRLRYQGARVARTDYHFWGPAWDYAPRKSSGSVDAAGNASFAVEVEKLGLTLGGRVRSASPTELTYDYAVQIKKHIKNAIGGGIEFMLTDLAERLGPGAEPPQLLENNRGFSWRLAADQTLRIEFEPALPKVYFERGNRFQIRCFFVGENEEPGDRQYRMRVQLPHGSQVLLNEDSRYDAGATGAWLTNTLLWNAAPIDLSYLNAGDRPAGQRGRVTAKAEQLVYADGTEARFWGTNVQATALFSNDKKLIEAYAQRIAAFGYNLVRLHHHDSHWVKPNVFELKNGTTQVLRDAALDSIDYWVKCLTERGIYVWLDLHVGRLFMPGDNIPGGEEIKNPDQAKGFNYVNPRIEALMEEFSRQYLARKNRYTGKVYATDPAVLGVLVTNENDLTTHFGSRLSEFRGAPVHEGMLAARLAAFTKERGLPPIPTRETWRAGIQKIAIVDLEGQFFKRQIDALRAFNVGALVATTNYWGNEPFYSLPSLAVGDVVDAHSYGDEEYLSSNPRLEPNYLTWIAGAQVLGKPLSISEWALEGDRRDRYTATLLLAAVASLQGWDAPMHFTYQQDGLGPPVRASLGNNSYDPAIMAMMPAAALMFRERHVKPAERTYVVQLSRDTLYNQANSPKTSLTLSSLTEQSRVFIGLPNIEELAWDNFASPGDGVTVVTDLRRDFIPPGRSEVVSDTGELRRNWQFGYHTVNTPRTQAAAGWIGAQRLELADVVFEITTPSAAISVSSLDQKPLANSQRILLSVASQAKSGAKQQLPYQVQAVTGSLFLKRTGKWQLVPLAPDGKELRPEAAKIEASGARIQLLGQVPTHWFLLVQRP